MNRRVIFCIAIILFTLTTFFSLYRMPERPITLWIVVVFLVNLTGITIYGLIQSISHWKKIHRAERWKLIKRFTSTFVCMSIAIVIGKLSGSAAITWSDLAVPLGLSAGITFWGRGFLNKEEEEMA
ncbi:hypothetical protein ACFFGV_04110 [Pontibacillus salicampi]|uniref:Uncharacterized protein n=1 Tax=Pontibacillus salicampi TaxID=1449801 RepID=A0ABV6LK55_9BACI